jgi:hypothetical protein
METTTNKTKEVKIGKVIVVKHDVQPASISALLALGFTLVVLNKGE